MPTKNLIEFPYETKQSRHAGLILSPYVELEVRTKEGKFVSHRFIFDTGADFTSLPKYMAEIVGIDLKDCPQEVMYTAENEPMVTFHAKVKVRFRKKVFGILCVFTDRDDTPFLLGRVGFIGRFNMHLLAAEKKLVFEEAS